MLCPTSDFHLSLHRYVPAEKASKTHILYYGQLLSEDRNVQMQVEGPGRRNLKQKILKFSRDFIFHHLGV